MDLRVKDGVKKRKPPCNEGDRGSNFALPERGADFQTRCPVPKKPVKPPKAERQMTADCGLAGAPADGNVRWQPVCIGKARPTKIGRTASYSVR